MEQVKGKIKVALICHFSNSEVRKYLNLAKNRPIYSIARKIIGLPPKTIQYSDIAPWITSWIEEFNNRNDVELIIISAQTGLKFRIQHFKIENIAYYFFNTDFTLFLKYLIKNNFLWRRLETNSAKVRKIVKEVSPDIVVLSGSENCYVSTTIIQDFNLPKIVLQQTVYNNPDRRVYCKIDRQNAETELAIFKVVDYFGVYSRMHYDLIKNINPIVNIFDFAYPSKCLPFVKNVAKKYDFVNFAMTLDLRKGAHDSIRALYLVKKKYPNVKLNLVGGCSCKEELLQLIDELDLNDNVVFTPFFEKQADMFQHLQESRFAVLPCKMDVTSGTMSQAMYYELPLVVYKTTGTPMFNMEKECAMISEIEDIEALANNMLVLMNEPSKAEQLAKNAKEYITKKMDNKAKMDRLMADFRAVIDNYNNGTPIPEDLLFDVKKFPKF